MLSSFKVVPQDFSQVEDLSGTSWFVSFSDFFVRFVGVFRIMYPYTLSWCMDLFVYVLLIYGNYDGTAVLLGQDIFSLKSFFPRLNKG